MTSHRHFRIVLAKKVRDSLVTRWNLPRDLYVRVHAALIDLKTIDRRTLPKRPSGLGRIYDVVVPAGPASFHQFRFGVAFLRRRQHIFVASATYLRPLPPPRLA